MSRTHHYNPDWLDDDALVAGFIARHNEFTFLRDELARAPRVGSVQHHLLVGPRGAGKTTLLKRLAIAIRRDGALSDHLIALSFPEELYQVKDLADFWWAACEALGDELERLGDKAGAEKIFGAVDRAAVSRASATSEDGLTILLASAADIARRPVLLVDNLDLVFERIDKKGRKLKDPLSPAYWALREALSTTTSPIVIGGSVRLSEPFTDYDKAFYDFFLPKRLGKLSLGEVREVLEHLAEQLGAPEIKQRLLERPARIEALYDLTGGNPRAVGFIFQLLQQGPNRRAVEDFERLMDLTTPYYKARFEDLSEQAQVVMHALAIRRSGDGSALRFGHTAAEIATHAGLPTNTVSAQMDVLDREGLIEKSLARGRTQYRLAEQLFRLWLQMRGSRRIRQNVIGLTEFLEAMYDFDEMTADLKTAGHGLNAARYAFAVADTRHAAPLRRGLEAYGADCLSETMGSDMDGYRDRLPNSDLPQEVATLQALRSQLTRHPGHGLQPEEQDALLGSIELGLEKKQTTVAALCQQDRALAELASLRAHFLGERRRLARYGLSADDLTCLFKFRAKGFLPLPALKPGDADALLATQNDPVLVTRIWHLVGARDLVKFDADSALAWIAWGQAHAAECSSTEWANVAGSMRLSKQLVPATQVLELACQRGVSSRTWYERAVLLAKNNHPSEAVPAFEQAIKLGANDPWPLFGMGKLLAEELNRPIEAEEAYRKAIELDPAFAQPWNNLGTLLAGKLQRPNEAEEAYRKAIALDPAYALPWNHLGLLLADELERPNEAEEAFRKAIALGPALARPWNNLGALLAKKLNRPIEAEEAFRKAIALDPALEHSWGNLGRLLEQQGKREEAISAFAQAAQLDTDGASFWQANLRRLVERPLIEAGELAVRTGHLAALREALSELLAHAKDISATLADEEFTDKVLAPALGDEHKAAALLGMLWGLGYDKHARPLLLAVEAAVDNRPEALRDLEPEIRGAAQRMYVRLMAAKKIKKTKKNH